MPPMSPRNPPPKLRSTVKEEWGTPRQPQSHFEKLAVRRGYTIKAGASRRARLEQNRRRIPSATPPAILEVTPVSTTSAYEQDNDNA